MDDGAVAVIDVGVAAVVVVVAVDVAVFSAGVEELFSVEGKKDEVGPVTEELDLTVSNPVNGFDDVVSVGLVSVLAAGLFKKEKKLDAELVVVLDEAFSFLAEKAGISL